MRSRRNHNKRFFCGVEKTKYKHRTIKCQNSNRLTRRVPSGTGGVREDTPRSFFLGLFQPRFPLASLFLFSDKVF